MADFLYETLLKYKVFIIISWFLLFFVAEVVFPKAIPVITEAIPRLKRWGRNLILFMINGLLSPLIVLPISAWAASHAIEWRPSFMLSWQWIIVDVIILDFFIYWWHRMNHVIPFLWRFHEVHHLDEFLDTTSAVRFHFGEVIFSALYRAVILFICQIPFTTIIIAETLLLIASIFQHSNVRLPNMIEKPLTWIIVTPSWHWMHHHALRKDTDSNYSNVLTIWDRIFSSESPNTRTIDMKIGVEKRKEKSLHKLLLRPLDKA